MKVPVLRRRQNMELLAPIRTMGVAHEAKLLEDVERSIDRRGDDRGIAFTTALDKFRAGHVAPARRQDLDEGAALIRPALPA